MSRRKSEIPGHMNERDFPHVVELELPSGGFRSHSFEFDAFHRDRGIPIRRPTWPGPARGGAIPHSLLFSRP